MTSVVHTTPSGIDQRRAARPASGGGRSCRATWIKKIKTVCLVIAWFAATGAQWDIIQVVAWTRMTYNNSQSMSFGLALKRTFEPESSCELCKLVKKARRSEANQTASTTPKGEPLGKIHLFLNLADNFARPSSHTENRRPVATLQLASRRDQPPLPPPRDFA
jgi:hypothetical protein